MIDTNIIFSAIRYKGSVPHKAYQKAVQPPFYGLICEQTLEELRRAFYRKFPDEMQLLEHVIANILPVVEFVPIPKSQHPEELKIRDTDDRPILRAAISAKADILLTGDKDFLESNITNPRIITAAQFMEI